MASPWPARKDENGDAESAKSARNRIKTSIGLWGGGGVAKGRVDEIASGPLSTVAMPEACVDFQQAARAGGTMMLGLPFWGREGGASAGRREGGQYNSTMRKMGWAKSGTGCKTRVPGNGNFEGENWVDE